MPHNMVVLWPNMKQEVSPCPGWHIKAKLVSEACKSDHKLNEVDMKNEPQEAVGLADDAWEVFDWKN